MTRHLIPSRFTTEDCSFRPPSTQEPPPGTSTRLTRSAARAATQDLALRPDSTLVPQPDTTSRQIRSSSRAATRNFAKVPLPSTTERRTGAASRKRPLFTPPASDSEAEMEAKDEGKLVIHPNIVPIMDGATKKLMVKDPRCVKSMDVETPDADSTEQAKLKIAYDQATAAKKAEADQMAIEKTEVAANASGSDGASDTGVSEQEADIEDVQSESEDDSEQESEQAEDSDESKDSEENSEEDADGVAGKRTEQHTEEGSDAETVEHTNEDTDEDSVEDSDKNTDEDSDEDADGDSDGDTDEETSKNAKETNDIKKAQVANVVKASNGKQHYETCPYTGKKFKVVEWEPNWLPGQPHNGRLHPEYYLCPKEEIEPWFKEKSIMNKICDYIMPANKVVPLENTIVNDVNQAKVDTTKYPEQDRQAIKDMMSIMYVHRASHYTFGQILYPQLHFELYKSSPLNGFMDNKRLHKFGTGFITCGDLIQSITIHDSFKQPFKAWVDDFAQLERNPYTGFMPLRHLQEIIITGLPASKDPAVSGSRYMPSALEKLRAVCGNYDTRVFDICVIEKDAAASQDTVTVRLTKAKPAIPAFGLDDNLEEKFDPSAEMKKYRAALQRNREAADTTAAANNTVAVDDAADGSDAASPTKKRAASGEVAPQLKKSPKKSQGSIRGRRKSDETEATESDSESDSDSDSDSDFEPES
ncbi:uncharacterized protein HMPREF1541_09418 [Cyphellophora europaea CBS 101466]|uniref:Uncharacterized protein n=1 Tax=Cyphellophora europaea (strain CBS 101466) TaxID=1220924 RepID=W2SA27_CYPE1|nr:uncharacterized protein HMPREF1541_09418 [Cyphellophora europaea CBS 101466]ETN45586.1 hypothetical protein HMPREF1541_09418 [Cyphellophora europaea CBS 101466]